MQKATEALNEVKENRDKIREIMENQEPTSKKPIQPEKKSTKQPARKDKKKTKNKRNAAKAAKKKNRKK